MYAVEVDRRAKTEFQAIFLDVSSTSVLRPPYYAPRFENILLSMHAALAAIT